MASEQIFTIDRMLMLINAMKQAHDIQVNVIVPNEHNLTVAIELLIMQKYIINLISKGREGGMEGGREGGRKQGRELDLHVQY